MTLITQRIAAIAEELPPEKQAEVLDFAEFLKIRSASARGEPEGSPHVVRRLGTLAGEQSVPEDFDAPLPPDVQRYFDGEDDGVLGGVP